MSGIVNSTGAKSGIIGTITSAPVTGIDYEEGVWTPTSTGGASISFAGGTTQRYVKIGKMVMIHAQFNVDSSGSSSTQVIGGLPFMPTSGSWPVLSVHSAANPPAGICAVVPASSQDGIYMFENNPTTGQQEVIGNDLDSAHLRMSGTYQTA